MNSPAPLVSVITPTYNRAVLLQETAESILGQDYPAVEYLIVDDGSTDNTEQVVQSLVVREGHVLRYIKAPHGGEALAVNQGWRVATGDYVAIVSSDDPQPSNWLRTCVDFLSAHPKAVVGYPDWNIIGPNGQLLHSIRVPDYRQALLVAHLQCLPGPGALIRRSLANRKELRPPGFIRCADFDAWLHLSLQGDFVHIPHAVAQWREHGDGLSAGSGKIWFQEMQKVLNQFYLRPDLPEHVRTWQSASQTHLYYEASRKVWRDDFWLGVRLLAQAALSRMRHR